MEIIIIFGMVGVIITFVTWLGKEILKENRRKKKVEMIIFQKEMEAMRANEERRRANEERFRKECLEIAEKARCERTIDEIKRQYAPIQICQQDVSYKLTNGIADKFFNKNIIQTVEMCKWEGLKESTARIELEKLLSCSECNTVYEKFNFLNENMTAIKNLKNKCELDKRNYKIEMLDEEVELLKELKKAFLCLKNSKKCISNNGNIEMLITTKRPKELNMFLFKEEPMVLFWNPYFLCIFSNVILIFDDKGIFTSAVNPLALKIDVIRKIERVSVDNSEIHFTGITDTDSKCIEEGEPTYTWLHACKDGSQDRRYRDNPRTEHREDTYEYVDVQLMFANRSIILSASSQLVGDAFDRVIFKYSWDRNKFVGDLLQLMKNITDEDAQVKQIVNKCEDKIKSENIFCRVMESNEQ